MVIILWGLPREIVNLGGHTSLMLILETPHREAVRAVTLVRGIHSRRGKVQAVGARIVRITRPIDAERALTVHPGVGVVPTATSGKFQTTRIANRCTIISNPASRDN